MYKNSNEPLKRFQGFTRDISENGICQELNDLDPAFSEDGWMLLTDRLPLTRVRELIIDGQGRIFIQDAEFTLDDLVPKLQAIAKNGVDERILVRGDRTTDYGSILKVMGRLNDAGYKKIGLVSLPETASR